MRAIAYDPRAVALREANAKARSDFRAVRNVAANVRVASPLLSNATAFAAWLLGAE